MSTELEKARNGLAMPYDRERVWQLRLSYAKRARSCRPNVIYAGCDCFHKKPLSAWDEQARIMDRHL